jgi:hypothetical protein
VATRVKWMAAADATHRKPAAFDGSEAANSLHRILRTSGHEPAAGTEQRAHPALVTAKQCDEELVDHGMDTAPYTGRRGCRCAHGRV